ncbi:MAG: SusE domain-containing protein [Bacteroidales bacterium]|nr:SusE domain-containing protein [Bacteroidales bacterium]
MKKILYTGLIFLMLIFTFSCEKDIVDKVTLDISKVTGGTIANLSSSSYVLTYAKANDNFETITWDSTDYGYPTSITYILQIDVEGSDFENAVDLATTTDLSAEINIEDLNNVLVDDLSQAPEVPAAVQFRVISTIVSVSLDSVYSAPITVNITPYDPDIPPIYIVGSLQGWSLDDAIELQSTAPLIYSGFVDFETGDVFRFFELKSWDTGEQWGFSYFSGSIPAAFEDNGDSDSNFKFGSDILGTYAVQVDLNTKSIAIEKQLFPSALFLIGGDQAWNLEDPLALRHKGGGVFEGIETFTNGNEWRFFESASWGANQWNYNTFAEGTIDEKLSGPNGGDANFLFNGTTGIYKITVSTLDLSIVLEPAEMPTMYRVGGFNSWTFGESMTWIRGEKFTETSELVAGTEWRFFPESGNWGNTRNYTAFKNVPADLWSGPNGGDLNFLDLVSGTYTITIDVVQGIITGVPAK